MGFEKWEESKTECYERGAQSSRQDREEHLAKIKIEGDEVNIKRSNRKKKNDVGKKAR